MRPERTIDEVVDALERRFPQLVFAPTAREGTITVHSGYDEDGDLSDSILSLVREDFDGAEDLVQEALDSASTKCEGCDEHSCICYAR